MTSPRSFEISLLGEEDYDAWDDFVSGQERTGSIYSTARYLDILCRAAGGSFSVVAVRNGELFLGGIGLYRRHVDGRDVISTRMLLTFNGMVLRDDLLAFEGDGSTRTKCLDALHDFLSRQPGKAITLHCRDGCQDFRPFLERGWQATPTYTIVIPTSDSSKLWSRFDKNARRLVRRAENAGCTVEPDNDFNSFYHAHEEVHRRKGSPLYLPKESFRRYFDDLVAAHLGVIFTARTSGRAPAAAQLVLLGKHSCSHTVCAGSYEAHLSTGASYLLRWRAFVELGDRGYAMNDLTNASLGPVTKFKEQLGGNLKMDMRLGLRRRRRFFERGGTLCRAIRTGTEKLLRSGHR
jgi:hypothetical protein